VSDLVDPAHLPASWRGSGAWMLAPVAAEIGDEWADVPPAGALVALARTRYPINPSGEQEL